MLEIVPATRPAKAEKLERALRATGFGGTQTLERHADLLSSAEESCPHLPASNCDQLVRFYFMAALAATEMTPAFGDKWEKDVPVEGEEASGKIFVVFATRNWVRELRPPRTPRFLPIASMETTPLLEGERFPSTPGERELRNWLVHRAAGRALSAATVTSPAATDPFKAFTELKQWLHLSSKQLTSLLGIKRTTPNAWKREGRKPRYDTQLRLERLHAYVEELASDPDAAEKLARVRPILPTLMKAIDADAALPSATLEEAGVQIPFDWRRLNAFQAANAFRIAADEDGTEIGIADPVKGSVIEEDEDDLDLAY